MTNEHSVFVETSPLVERYRYFHCKSYGHQECSLRNDTNYLYMENRYHYVIFSKKYSIKMNECCIILYVELTVTIVWLIISCSKIPNYF